MGNRLFVGNLPYGAVEDDIKTVFMTVGEVDEINLVRYRDSGKSRGFAFVTMSTPELAEQAIAVLNGKPMKIGETERNILVTEAKPREEKQKA
ncbi:MAG: RNA-binding protein [Patescibacteria group bacterium]|jgi:RNA recognition motif-containing protein